jgi:hypothetical protein
MQRYKTDSCVLDYVIYLELSECMNTFSSPIRKGINVTLKSSIYLLFKKTDNEVVSSGIKCSVACWKSTDVSEEHAASIIRVEE